MRLKNAERFIARAQSPHRSDRAVRITREASRDSAPSRATPVAPFDAVQRSVTGDFEELPEAASAPPAA
jgi:hypothetical protein